MSAWSTATISKPLPRARPVSAAMIAAAPLPVHRSMIRIAPGSPAKKARQPAATLSS